MSAPYKPPKLPLKVAEEADIHIQSLSRINRGIKPPGIQLGALLSKIARTSPDLHLDVDLADWIPQLIEDPVIWTELVHLVKRRTALGRQERARSVA